MSDEHTQGTIILGGKPLATLASETPEAYTQAKVIVQAGLWLTAQMEIWGYSKEEFWKMSAFPSGRKAWQRRRQRMVESRLADESEWTDQMHALHWTLQELWTWFHDLAENAENSNFKRQAGQLLGQLYHTARLRKGPAKRLSESSEQFKKALVRFSGKRAPASWLVRWVRSKLWAEHELWRDAVDAAAGWRDNTQEGQVKATVKQFCDFDFYWRAALEASLRKLWDSDSDGLPPQKGRKRPAWSHYFGTADDEKMPAGYWLVREEFDSWLLEWTRACEHRKEFLAKIYRVLDGAKD